MKRKLEYQCHVYFEHNLPSVILRTLQFLKEHNLLYYVIDKNSLNFPDYLIQSKVNKTFLSDVNVLDYVASDESIPIMIEAIDCGSSKCCGRDKGVIQDALNSTNWDY